MSSNHNGHPDPGYATIIIGADLCPIGRNRPLFLEGNSETLFNDLLPELNEADLAIANLECPFVAQKAPIPKTGPAFGESGDCIRAIKRAGFDLLALANNHIMDHGEPGLRHTLQVCEREGIGTVGAGINLAAARRMFIRKFGELRIAVLAVAENEFSLATRNSAGANPLDLIDCVRSVKHERPNFDYLIVLLHGADEFHVPSPRIKDTCHFLVELGANAVIVQHPHCLGGYEEYRGAHIVYGQGALIMDEEIYRDLPSFHEGFLVKLRIATDAKSTIQLVPYVQSESESGARKMPRGREQEFRLALSNRSQAIQDDAFVEAEWLRFCEERKHSYVSCLLGHNRVLRRLNAQGWIARLVHGRQALLGARNVVCCETHREAIGTIFNHQLF
jgi:poly-gamma-glutamate capsule biosynthesis protein CapA/YwtB (metallophosphatase superfamily)